MNRYKFYSMATGALICEGTAAECAAVLQIDTNYLYEIANNAPKATRKLWRIEVSDDGKKPKREKPITRKRLQRMTNAAVLQEQRDLMRKNGCSRCLHWGVPESCGGEGCGFVLLGRGCRKINPDGSCGSREERPKEPAAD